IGVSITNIGEDISFLDRGFPLPRTFRVAAGLEFQSRPAGELGYWSPDARSPVVTVRPAIAYEKHIATSYDLFGPPMRNEDVDMVNAGGEVRAVDFLAFRAGYVHDSTGDNSGAT